MTSVKEVTDPGVYVAEYQELAETRTGINITDYWCGLFRFKAKGFSQSFEAEINEETGATNNTRGAGMFEKQSKTPEGEVINRTEFYADVIRADSMIVKDLTAMRTTAVNGKLRISESGTMKGFRTMEIPEINSDPHWFDDDLPKENIDYIIYKELEQ